MATTKDEAPQRLFVALPIPEHVQASIYDRVPKNAEQSPFCTFQHGVMMHATIVPPFDGTVEETRNRIAEALQKGSGPILARLERFCNRPATAKRPHATLRVMIAPNPQLTELSQRVADGLHADGPPFSGHITLARIGEEAPNHFVADFCATCPTLGDVEWTVQSVGIFETDWTRSIPYSLEAEVMLNEGVL